MKDAGASAHSLPYNYAGALIIAAAGVGLRLALNPILHNQLPYLVINLPVAISAFLLGLGPGLVTTAVLQIASAWLYLPPVHSFATYQSSDQVGLLISTLGAVGIALIVSSLRRTQQDLKREKKIAVEANEAKDRFLSMITHELRNPINAIALSASAMRMRPQDQSRIVLAATRIERAARIFASMVESLLDSTRVATGQFRVKLAPIDFVPVIRSALDVMTPVADAKSIAIRTNLLDAPVMIQGDVERLIECIANVVANAVKFTPRGGHIDIALECEDSGARLSVRDDGEGIEPEFIPQIFQRFTKARPGTGDISGGLGLGLSIVKHVLDQHDGSVTAFSEGKGRGATFTIVLPLADRPRVSASARR